MNVSKMQVSQQEAYAALREYKQHRSAYDKRDWEIERIYRKIAQGKTVISALDSIIRGGVDEQGRPRLAIMRADQKFVHCDNHSDKIVFRPTVSRSRAAEWYFEIPWPNRFRIRGYSDCQALLPRIPPQYRPPQGELAKYHLLWEASWTDIPRDPYLLRRIGKDSWVVVAAWDLTDVEVAVMRANTPTQETFGTYI